MPSSFLPSFRPRKPNFSGHFVALIFASVRALATGRALARAQTQAPFKPASHATPAELANLDSDGYRAFLQHDNQTLSETWTNLITP